MMQVAQLEVRPENSRPKSIQTDWPASHSGPIRVFPALIESVPSRTGDYEHSVSLAFGVVRQRRLRVGHLQFSVAPCDEFRRKKALQTWRWNR